MTRPPIFPELDLVTVCGGKMKTLDSYPGAFIRGQQVYFCLPACLAAFESDPERFMAGDLESHVDE